MTQQNPMTRSENQLPSQAREPHHWVAPPVDIFENENEVLLVADMPGVSRESLSVEIDRNELRIEATRDRRVGRVSSDFRRRFTLPDGIDASKVSAQLENGVLRLHLPKSEQVKARRIEVKGS